VVSCAQIVAEARLNGKLFFLTSVPQDVFEMVKKRRFLSKGERWTLSVWNRGKKDKNGKTRDGNKPTWTIYRDGKDLSELVRKIDGPCRNTDR
jgi:hypothetical protein